MHEILFQLDALGLQQVYVRTTLFFRRRVGSRPPPHPSAREEAIPPSSHRPPAEVDDRTQELQALLQEHGTASEGSDPAQRDAFAVIQGRNSATSLMVDTILEQWEAVIQPLDVQGLVADDREMGTNSQEL